MPRRDRISARLAQAVPYSYRDDPMVPPFPDDKGLIVFDGVCVLCERSARFVLEHDRDFAFRLTTAQSPLGQALFRHYGLDTEAYETNLVLVDGRPYAKLGTIAAVCGRLGGGRRALSLLRFVPRALGDPLYDLVARNRYRLFGRHDACMMPQPQWRKHFI